jgi:hypothetical protein
VLAVIGLWPPLTRLKVAYAVALLLAFDISLGMHGLTYHLLFLVPVFQGLRATARFAVFVQLMLALFAAYGFARLLERAIPRRLLATALVVGVAGVLVLEYTNRSLPIVRAQTHASTFSKYLLDQPPKTVVLELPVPTVDALPGLDPHYVFESTFHWRPLINGYTAFVPPRYMHFLERMEDFPNTPLSIHALRASGAEVVVLHTRWLKSQQDQDAMAWLQQQPDFRFEGDFVDHAGPVAVFRRIQPFDRVASEAP